MFPVAQQNNAREPVEFKNVQRRVYDTLNVLQALDIVQKDSKYDLKFNPQNDFNPGQMEMETDHNQRANSIEEKRPQVLAEQMALEYAEMATVEDLQQAESELSKQRRRVREKQKLMMELIKQQVAMTKLKHRN